MCLGISQRLILYPNSTILCRNLVCELKRILAHTRVSPVHVVVVEVAIRSHIEHVSVTTVPIVRRHAAKSCRLTYQNYILSFNFYQDNLKSLINYHKYLYCYLFNITLLTAK